MEKISSLLLNLTFNSSFALFKGFLLDVLFALSGRYLYIHRWTVQSPVFSANNPNLLSVSNCKEITHSWVQREPTPVQFGVQTHDTSLCPEIPHMPCLLYAMMPWESNDPTLVVLYYVGSAKPEEETEEQRWYSERSSGFCNCLNFTDLITLAKILLQTKSKNVSEEFVKNHGWLSKTQTWPIVAV